jgi:hypothetical protein
MVNCRSAWSVENAINYLSSGCSATCQQPFFRSNLDNHLAPASVSNVSSIPGNQKQSFIVSSFSFLQSMRKRRSSFFSRTRTTGDDQGLSDSSITPRRYMWSSSSPPSASFAKEIFVSFLIGRAFTESLRWWTLSVRP